MLSRTDNALQRIKTSEKSEWDTYAHLRRIEQLLTGLTARLRHVEEMHWARSAQHFMHNLMEHASSKRNENSKKEMLRINSGIERGL